MLMLSVSKLGQRIHLWGKLVLLHFGQVSQSVISFISLRVMQGCLLDCVPVCGVCLGPGLLETHEAHWPPRPFSAPLQLEVLTNLANETNIPTVLREFQVRARDQLPGKGPQRVALQLFVLSDNCPHGPPFS